MSRIDRRAYAAMYGPTTGDRVGLGDTGLVIENEECIYTLAKGETYFYDAEAIKEPIPGSLPRTRRSPAVGSIRHCWRR